MPPGRMSLKIQVVFFLFFFFWCFFSFDDLKAVIGCLGARDVFVVASKFNSEKQAMFCIIIVVAILV